MNPGLGSWSGLRVEGWSRERYKETLQFWLKKDILPLSRPGGKERAGTGTVMAEEGKDSRAVLADQSFKGLTGMEDGLQRGQYSGRSAQTV